MTNFDQRGQTVPGNQYNAGGDMSISQGGNMSTGDTYSGDLRGAIFNVRSTLSNTTQAVRAIPYASDEEKQILENLVKQLTEALEKVIQEHPETVGDVEAITQATQVLIKGANQEKPNPGFLKITSEGLIKAAETLAKLTPAVLSISKQIVKFITQMVVNLP